MPGNKGADGPAPINWQLFNFEQLSNNQLYELMQLRVDVFVVEQTCIYRELDDLDRCADTLHLLGYRENNLLAYARAMGPAPRVKAVLIGRVVVSKQARGGGVARILMKELMRSCRAQWTGVDIRLSAQTQVIGFYESLGFRKVSDEYLEYGIAHIDMTYDV